MKNLLKRIFLIYCLLTILLFNIFYPVFADENLQNENTNEENVEEKEDYEIEIENLEEQKEELENAISSNEALIGVVEGVLSETLEEIEVLNTKIQEKKNEIAILEAR